MEKQLNRKEIYDGKVIHVVKDDILTSDNKQAIREVVLHNGGACIALKDECDGKYFLVKQYRYCHEKEMLEFCAGKIEKDENPDLTIVREAKEELGYLIKDVVSLGYMIPTCGYSSEKIYLYFGKAYQKVKQHYDEDESIEVYKYSFEEIKQMIIDGIIDDGKTIALMYKIELMGLN